MKNAAELNKIASERNRLAQEASDQESDASYHRASKRIIDQLAKIEKMVNDVADCGGYEVEFHFIPLDATENNCGMDLTHEGYAVYHGIIDVLTYNGFTVEEETHFDTWNLTIRW
jgi:hypothetical protein